MVSALFLSRYAIDVFFDGRSRFKNVNQLVDKFFFLSLVSSNEMILKLITSRCNISNKEKKKKRQVDH